MGYLFGPLEVIEQAHAQRIPHILLPSTLVCRVRASAHCALHGSHLSAGAEYNKCSTFPRFTPFSFLCFFDKKYHRHKLLESTSPLIHLKRVPIYTSDDSYVYVKAINIQPYKRIDCLLYEKINEN